MSEFSLIDRYCKNIGAAHLSTIIGVGDDAAVLDVPADTRVAISVDTMVEGVHFYPGIDPARLAHKILAVNLSDMAAMGAEPKWATLALTLPHADPRWLSGFSASLNRLAERYGVQLIGGDTTQGGLTLSLQIIGLLPKDKVLTRNGARVGDRVYVTNTLGDAALALYLIENQQPFTKLDKEALLSALECPQPQVNIGLSLLDIASACVDVSDGLLADLSHVAKASQVSINVDVDRVPLSKDYAKFMTQGGSLDMALSGGDDYQLAFMAAAEHDDQIQALAASSGVPLTCIGEVVERVDDLVCTHASGGVYQLSKQSGYEHFSSGTTADKRHVHE